MNQVSTVGLDLAKYIFQLHGADSAGAVVFRQKLRRGQGVHESVPEQFLTQENDMLRKHMAACLVASALALVPAMAQTTGAGSGAGAGSAAGGGAGSTAGGGGGAPGDLFYRQQPGQVLASRQLVGATVVGPNNERIGDVNDVLLDRNGQAVAIVVGVGGFLGIGEKDVAVSFNQVQFTPRKQGGGAGGSAGAGGTGATGTAGTAGTAGAGGAGTAGAGGTTGSANPGAGIGAGPGSGNGGAAGAGGAGTGAASGSAGMSDQIMIRMSKQDLQNA